MKKGNTLYRYLLVLLVSYPSLIMSSSINIAIGSAPSNLSPFFSTDANSQNINRLMHLSLLDFNRQMETVCMACKSFSDKIEDGKHIVSFELRKNLKFWDGTELTAENVKKSHEHFTETDKIKSIFRFAFGNIEKVDIQGKYKFRLIYKKYGLDNISNLVLFKIIKIDQPYKGLKSIVGAGDFKLINESPLSITLQNINNNNKIVFKVVKDETTLALKLINKEVDGSLATLSPRKIEWMKKNSKGLKFYEISSSNYVYINFNHKKEIFKDKRMKQAFGMYLPIDEIVKFKFKNQVIASTGMFGPSFKGLYNEEAKQGYNSKAADKLLIEMGYKKNNSGNWSKDNKNLKITWKVSNSKSSFEIVKTLANYYKKNGIEVEILTQEWGTFMRSYKSGDYDIVLSQWVGFTDGGMIEYVFHSNKIPPKGANRGYYTNKSVDNLIDKASLTNVRKDQNKYLKEALGIINTEYAYINLWHPKISWIFNDKIKNVKVYPNGSFVGLSEIRSE
ncbi:ABC transporter substrate-binding protein [Bacteriovoracaceae bacterium]|nr:ABC transporter substrate-binding protein [Bacteriovoracaceae bacterium]